MGIKYTCMARVLLDIICNKSLLERMAQQDAEKKFIIIFHSHHVLQANKHMIT